jgi:hypothetical protein
MSDGSEEIDRDRAGRFRPGARSPNPRGRPRKAAGVDAALTRALAEKVSVTERGKRTQKTKLDIAATQVANKAAGGDLRAGKMVFDQARKAEERAEAERAGLPVMTKSDREIVDEIVERIRQVVSRGGDLDHDDA